MKKKGGNDVGLILIAILKLLKGLVLLIVAAGLLRLLHRDVESTALRWVDRFRLDPDNHYVHRALARIFRVTPKQLKELSAGTFFYSGLFLTEGVGLLKKKHWAEYLTTISTALFIPFEAYEVERHFTWVRVAVLAINVATVVYLASRIKRRR